MKIVGIFFFFNTGIYPGRLFCEKAEPNIIFISIDDLNDWVDFWGINKPLPLIWINWLQGAILYKCSLPSSRLWPLEDGNFTGMQPVTSGIYDNNIKFSRDLPEIISLPEHFEKNNYKVFGVVNYSRGT